MIRTRFDNDRSNAIGVAQLATLSNAGLLAALDTARTPPALRATARIRGLTLTATDLDRTTGEGPLVEGPGEALLMAIAGRHAVVDELARPGVTTLAERAAA
jgi:hypothetical protein